MVGFGRGKMTTTIEEHYRTLIPGLGALLDFLAASHVRAVAFLVAICLVSYLPGFFNIPPLDRDEARFVQATKQMIESGDYVDIRFQEEVRYKKPVGIYWLQAAAVRAAEGLGASDPRTTIWLYRLPSLIGAIGAVLLTYWTALAFGTRRTAYLSALMLACSLLLGVEARLAKTDAMLLLTVVAAFGALARAYLAAPEAPMDRRTWLVPAMFWTALAGGVLLKGPVILILVALAVAALVVRDRSAHWLAGLRPAAGAAWLLLLVLPWFVAILRRTGVSFFVESIGNDLLSKMVGAQESHGAPPGYYLATFWVTFWPAAPLAAVAASRVWQHHREPATQFLLAWLVPAWLLFELVPTKLPHYVLPLYPAIAILIARTMAQGGLSHDRRLVRANILWPAVTVMLPIAAVIAVIVLRRQLGLLAWPFSAAAMIFGFLAWRFYETDGAERSLLRAAVAAIMLSVAVPGAIVPLLRPLFPSALLAYNVHPDCERPLYASAGYHEPSLVFLFGTSTRLTDGQGAADFLLEGGCRFAFIEARHERAFVQRAEAIGLRYAPGPRVEGINYTAGHSFSIAIYRSEGRS
ncbi:MAG: glycosyltransferase family 39 protein [Alphaproteobacteria bacterium]|nr:MAG: glycosyltransferase family 39 protein [Alphaproteobacteria bacterium]